MRSESNIILIDPIRESEKNDQKTEITQPLNLEAQWQTPGLYLAQRVANNSLVRFVGERVQTDYLQIIIVVDDDPDELLDNIFTVEQEMYKKFNKLQFDVRVRVIPVNEDLELIKKTTIGHYDRSRFKF